MVINNNSNVLAIPDSADNSLAATTGYTLATGTGAPWSSSNLSGITFSVDKLTVPVTGIYELSLFAFITQGPAINNKVAIRYRVNGTTFGARRAAHKIVTLGENFQLNMTEHVALSANDYVQIMYAGSIDHDAIINDASVNLKLIRQTA